ncbi:ER membrane calcium transmembrane transporter [Schizosaccharomyces osmophilus]|uniref:ER membrane calcium transmembrane transporter n=1 Tax=Schizosaccharomyces osmophilus TaxID=2545709 RepID=A0AAE9WB09_9SCHI|nr:ER membrane calcium transmembrane transporter [Schizosaccharomyces osmophilus]WBW71982.1 ER membrane calcium transmembrane transporter [Schizosaccharomyces osmophilus]
MSSNQDWNHSQSGDSAKTITQNTRQPDSFSSAHRYVPSGSISSEDLGDFVMPEVHEPDSGNADASLPYDSQEVPRQGSRVQRKISSNTDPVGPSSSSVDQNNNYEYRPYTSLSMYRPRQDGDFSPSAQSAHSPDPRTGPMNLSKGRQTASSVKSEESLNLKARQTAINETRAFGIRLWKPALYKKLRSVNRDAEIDIHDEPLKRPSKSISNWIWFTCFGIPLFSVMFLCFLFFSLLSYFNFPYAVLYKRLCQGLMWYLLYPFGQHVRHKVRPRIANSPTLGRRRRRSSSQRADNLRLNFLTFSFCENPMNRALDCEASKGPFSISMVVYYTFFYLFITPSLLLVSAICMFSIFFIPCARTLWTLWKHLHTCPLAISFRNNIALPISQESLEVVLLCVRQAASSKYYKYTVDGIYIIYFDMLALIFPTIIIGFFGPKGYWFSSPMVIFTASLISIIPLAYFIGMAVASISAQSSMGMGAFINAFFGSVIEVFLYSVALRQGNAQLVEGSIIGSILAGLLLMPGLSMCAGAVKKKFQFFNIKSAGATSTMLLFAVLGVFAPTMLFQIYGTFTLECTSCGPECQTCTKRFILLNDEFYQERIRPFTYICAVLLLLSYGIGLWFTLRTHAAHIWENLNVNEASVILAKPEDNNIVENHNDHGDNDANSTSREPFGSSADYTSSDTSSIQDFERTQQKPYSPEPQSHLIKQPEGHSEDAPNWSRLKSAVILLSATFAYALIAEILVQNVDTVMEKYSISEKLLGLILFALVPNTTEFMNAISFALNDNIALSMEIGSAYALQVCLLQIPCLMAYSAFEYHSSGATLTFEHLFTLIFPSWDMICIMICVFLLTYVHSEGKSTYFKGSILVLAYLVSMSGFMFFNV